MELTHARPQEHPTHPDRTYWLGPELVSIELTAQETSGELGLFTATVPPMGGPPPHVHRKESETFYVLEGTFEFFVDGTFHIRRAGGTAYVPAGTLHTFRNIGETEGRLLTVVSPGGFEGFFAACGVPEQAGPQPMTDALVARMLVNASAFNLAFSPSEG